MKSSRFNLAGLFVAVLFFNTLLLPVAAAPAKETTLINFTDIHRERDGSIVRGYEWASGDWEKHIRDMPRQGCLIQSPTGKGNLGENKTMVEFDKSNNIAMVFLIGNANKATAINFNLADADGTEQSWTIPFEGLNKGQEYHFPLDLTKPTNVSKPGKTPGLDLKKIESWNISGNWAEPNLEVLLIKVVAPKS